MPVLAQPSVLLDVAPLVATWRNTNAESRGVAVYEIERSGDGSVIVNGAPAAVFALETGDRVAQAFSARLRINDTVAELQANIKGGVLVVASFHTSADGSGYFHREFYYRSAR